MYVVNTITHNSEHDGNIFQGNGEILLYFDVSELDIRSYTNSILITWLAAMTTAIAANQLLWKNQWSW